ncbi:hypothetical protein D1007_33127 [Hordeum vulgare]|nr:hypothetical protein D1007_33127 [Hordeum vulgare]
MSRRMVGLKRYFSVYRYSNVTQEENQLYYLAYLFSFTKFLYPAKCEKWILKTTGRDWRRFKAGLKEKLFSANKKRKSLYKLCPEYVDSDQWCELVRFWKSREGRAVSEKNKTSRSMVKTSHTAGTKSFARWAEDLRQEDPEKKQPHRAKVYLATHRTPRKAKDKNKLVENSQTVRNGESHLEVLNNNKRKIVQANGPGEENTVIKPRDTLMKETHPDLEHEDCNEFSYQEPSSLANHVSDVQIERFSG